MSRAAPAPATLLWKLPGSLGAAVTRVSKAQGGFLGSTQLSQDLAAAGAAVFLGVVAAFGAGVGTGSTVVGAGRFLHQHFQAVENCPLKPAESPTLPTGYKVWSLNKL